MSHSASTNFAGYCTCGVRHCPDQVRHEADGHALDVDRLHQALLNASWPGGVMAGFTRDAAVAIASEYAALER